MCSKTSVVLCQSYSAITGLPPTTHKRPQPAAALQESAPRLRHKRTGSSYVRHNTKQPACPLRTMGMSALRPKQLCFWMMHSENSSSFLLS